MPATATPAHVLRPGLLDAVTVLLAGAEPPSAFGEAVRARCGALGARTERVVVDPSGEEDAGHAGAHVVVWDGASLAGPRPVLDGAWLALRPLARAMIDAGTGGKLLLVAPPPGDAGAEAARAGLENLARTLSIEWARFGVRLVAVHPGLATDPGTVAGLCAFLASPAGDYHSGSLLALDTVAGAPG